VTEGVGIGGHELAEGVQERVDDFDPTLGASLRAYGVDDPGHRQA